MLNVFFNAPHLFHKTILQIPPKNTKIESPTTISASIGCANCLLLIFNQQLHQRIKSQNEMAVLQFIAPISLYLIKKILFHRVVQFTAPILIELNCRNLHRLEYQVTYWNENHCSDQNVPLDNTNCPPRLIKQLE